MRDYSTPLTVALPSTGSIVDDIVVNGQEYADTVAFSRRVEGEWQEVTARQFLAGVRQVASGVIAAGIEPGDRVALLSKTRYEWTLLDYAIWSAGAVSVPIYETSSPEQIAGILSDCGARAVVVENELHRARVEQVRDCLE